MHPPLEGKPGFLLLLLRLLEPLPLLRPVVDRVVERTSKAVSSAAAGHRERLGEEKVK